MTVPLYSRENDDVYAENVRNELFDIDKYVNLANEKWKDPPCISFALCINSSSENKLSFDEEYENLYKIFTQIEKSGIGTIPYIRFLPKNVYSQCTDYFEAGGVIKSTFKDMVRNYPIQISNTTTLFVSFQDGKLKLTKDEYIKQRKEVN